MAITLVQAGTVVTASPVTMASVSTGGRLLVIVVECNLNPTLPAGWVSVTNTTWSRIFCYPGNPGGISSVALTSPGTVQGAQMLEFAGAATISPVDQTGAANATVTTSSPMNISTSGATALASELAVSGAYLGLGTSTKITVSAGAGFTQAGQVGNAVKQQAHVTFDYKLDTGAAAQVITDAITQDVTGVAGSIWDYAIATFAQPSAGPTLRTSVTTSAASGTTLVSPAFTPQTGDIIVLKQVTEDASDTISGPTNSGSTFSAWTSRVTDATASRVGARISTATCTAGGTSSTVTANFSSSTRHHSLVVEVWQNAQLAGTPATCDTTGSGAPTATVTTVAANSVVSWCDGDWAAVTGAAAYRSAAYQDGIDQQGGLYCAYYAYQAAASAGAQTIGLTAPAGQTYTLLGIEIQLAAAAPSGLLPQQLHARSPVTGLGAPAGEATYGR